MSQADNYETHNDVRTPTYEYDIRHTPESVFDAILESIINTDRRIRVRPFVARFTRQLAVVVEPFDKCDDRTCSVCLDEKEHDQFAKLNCNHVFCDECVSKVMTFCIGRNCCPLCRATIDRIAVQTEAQLPLFEDTDLQDPPIPPMDLHIEVTQIPPPMTYGYLTRH